MRKLVSSLLIILACLYLVSAQSVKVTRKKVIYKRVGKNVPDYKREIEINYPIISGKISSTAKQNMLRGLDYWRVFDTSLREELSAMWLSSFDYEVKYNANNILDIWLTMEGVGAYPDSSTKYVVLDVGTGKTLHVADLFINKKLPSLRNQIRGAMKKSEDSLETSIKNILMSERQDILYEKYHPGPSRLELKDLDGFSISNTGVTFIFNYSYAHIMEAEEPSGEFLLTWKQLKPFIKPNGLLGQFVR